MTEPKGAAANAFSSRLSTMWLARSLRHLETCRSTNDEAATWARQGAPHGAVVIADAQSGGRGRLGRSWHSPAGENLYFSVVLRPRIAPHLAPPITLVAAVALAEAVSTEATDHGAAPELKWPNDLLIDGKKVAGILTEMATSGSRIEHVIMGIGVNLATLHFPEELAGRATSLALALGRTVDRETFAASLSGSLERWYDRFVEGGPQPIVAAWKARARLFGKTITVTSGSQRIEGVAEDLDGDGTLLVRTANGEQVRVVAGEIA